MFVKFSLSSPYINPPMKYFVFFLFLWATMPVYSQIEVKGKINWIIQEKSDLNNQYPLFIEAQRNSRYGDKPIYITSINLPSNGSVRAELVVQSEEIINFNSENNLGSNLENSYRVNTYTASARGQYKAIVEIIPYKKISNTTINILKEFSILLFHQPNIASGLPSAPFTRLSELNSGQIFKIAIPSRGIYKIDKNFFENKLKINVAGVNPKNIRILGNGGTRLPELNSQLRLDDLKENKIYFEGEEDGIFNDGDYILFYANGPDKVIYNELDQKFDYDKNPYSNQSYFFIKIDVKPGIRISKKSILQQTDYSSNTSIDYYHHEVDLINLLDDDDCNHGSGQKWFGEELSNSRKLDLSTEVNLEDIISFIPSLVTAEFASRSPQVSTLNIKINSTQNNLNLGASPFNCTSRYATNNYFEGNYFINNAQPSVEISFPQTSVNSDGWLNYFQITYTKSLSYNDKSCYIFDPKQKKFNSTLFTVKNSKNVADLMAWDITDPTDISEIPIQKSNNTIAIADNNNQIAKTYVVFSKSESFKIPEFISLVENQNLHELDQLDLVIIYHSTLKKEAERLLKHRTQHSNLTGKAVDIDQVANEFGSGTKDPTAIKDFMRMLFSRNPKFKYLILFGNASYDYRHIAPNTNDYNLVPTYETIESLDPILAYPTDDYFGLLDDNEGDINSGLLDIEIGRILARNPDEANIVIDKIIRYDTDPKELGEWKLNLLFSADDEDGNNHISDVDRIATETNQKYLQYNQQKIYLDAYEQITTPGGERYPEVNKSLTDEIYKGAFVYVYLGHGGPTGLAQERVLQENDIKNWDNEYKSPLMITATCSFSPYDDPRINSAGQLTHNQKNGTIALFSTVRAVYANLNYALTAETFNSLFEKENNIYPTLGDVLLTAKNRIVGENSRKYALFGDPAQKLAYPKYEAEVISINDRPVIFKDTIKALQKVKLAGIIKNENGVKHTGFNGLIYVTIFDKPVSLKTRANNKGSIPFSFKLQQNILFKGISNVNNGEWQVEFIVPKDINFNFGEGKISLYASNLKDEDAAGYTNQFYIGGFIKDTIKDDKAPVVKLFINNADFVNGGICNENPKIYSELSDDNGINITGNSIGHDLIAILDGNVQNPIELNNFFNAKVNDYREGTVTYPLKNLSIGRHTLSLSAWDIANNQGSSTIEFNVVSSDDVSLEKVYNYPNPFSNKTNFQFEINYINIPLEVSIQIYSITGKVVKTIQKNITPSGYRIDDIEWDGRDDLGSKLANGVYLYRIGVFSETKELSLYQKSAFQKLVILR